MSERGKQVCFCFETRLTVSSAFKADISIDKFPDHGQLDLQDFSTQIAWWSSYRQECKTHGATVGANRYVPPCLAEHIAGKMLVLIFLTVKVHFFFCLCRTSKRLDSAASRQRRSWAFQFFVPDIDQGGIVSILFVVAARNATGAVLSLQYNPGCRSRVTRPYLCLVA